MITKINVGDVTAVLLADGWYAVVGSSFVIAPMEFRQPTSAAMPWFAPDGEREAGFRFLGEDGRVFGRMSALLAVRTAD